MARYWGGEPGGGTVFGGPVFGGFVKKTGEMMVVWYSGGHGIRGRGGIRGLLQENQKCGIVVCNALILITIR